MFLRRSLSFNWSRAHSYAALNVPITRHFSTRKGAKSFLQEQEEVIEQQKQEDLDLLLGSETARQIDYDFENRSVIDMVDFYDTEFQLQLKQFCHIYQIPYLEAEVPKAAKNAAKIYFKLMQDDAQSLDRFRGTKLMAFLRSVEATDIDDSFNPNKLKDKWIKFFRGNMTRPQVDADTALKSVPNDNQGSWLKAEINNLNSYQLVRALLVSSSSTRSFDLTNRNKSLQLILF